MAGMKEITDKIDLLMWIDSHFTLEELEKLISDLKKTKDEKH